MSSPAPVAPAHRIYKKVTAKNAKCDICNSRNLGVMQKCVTCGVTTCEHCEAAGRYDSKHNLSNLTLDWAKPNPHGKGIKASVRGNEAVVLLDSSDEDDGLFVPQTPRAPLALGTSRREGLIRERATMTAACNLRRAHEDQASQRQFGLGDGPVSRSSAQSKHQGSSFTHDSDPKSGPSVVGDDDLMEIPAPSSLGQFAGTIRDAEANITQHLRDENKVLAAEVRRLKDKERSRVDEDRRLREQFEKQTQLAEESRVAYHREVSSHKQTIEELSDFRKKYDDYKEQLTKLSSETMPVYRKTSLGSASGTGTSEGPQPVLSLAMTSNHSTDHAGSTTRAEARRIRFSDLPAVKEARLNQINAGLFSKDGMVTTPPTRIPRDPFQAKRRKHKHTSSDTGILDPVDQASAIEDKDTSMEDASNDDTISLTSANTANESPGTTKGKASADKTKEMPPVATSQAGSTTKSAGTQTRLSAATYVGTTTPISRDLGAAVHQAIFGRTHPALLRIPAAGPGHRGGSVDDRMLFGVQRKWERSESFQKVKAARGPMDALQVLETAAILGGLAEGIDFPSKTNAYIQGVRKALLCGDGGFVNRTGNGS